ncbi:NAD(P)-dependent oxidoreductase [Glaciimonas sp. PCH181]|uniref:NAD-dependent epimerase/dehydratase family protein n=1 Tax=Glaciimonas sp. PCH181 TaxID=2133943 RepID=UPI000D3BB3C1|nr:SDR family NAD(P)-dependent oxidoreductase [Glaciimonas sp. PCH181]PUA20523.1 epimerase [Glaciimonas sp. PCH181]
MSNQKTQNQSSVLITGGAGFIGQSIAKVLLAQGANVRILDNFSPQIHSLNCLPISLAKVDLIKADVRDRDAMRQALSGIDTIVHLAAETGTGQSMYEIDRYFSVNVQGTATLLDLIQNDACGEKLQSLVVASSRAIYGEGAYYCDAHDIVYPEQRARARLSAGEFDPVCPICNNALVLRATTEEAPFKPMSMYGLTKQMQEQAVLMLARTRGINGFGLRYQNVYGPGQSLKNPYTGILAVFSNLARQDQAIEIYEDGLESRDFVYIDDVVEATLRCINYKGNFVGALNIGSGEATSVLAVAEQIKSFFASNSEISVSGAFRVGDIRHNIANIEIMQKILGFTPIVSFKDGLKNFLEWAAKQPVEDKAAYTQSVNELLSQGLMGSSKKV